MISDDQNPFYLTQPARRSGSGALFLNPDGHVLLVEPNYKPNWEIPGGIVERGEDPRTCCQRECLEEIGLEIVVGRLLVLGHQTDSPPRGDSIMFVYDGGIISDRSAIRLQASELVSYRFIAGDDLEQVATERLARRIRAAIIARETGRTIEMVNGKVIE
jgi:ADP-ribose pyrophosphatase YjhB (NUDIX family)